MVNSDSAAAISAGQVVHLLEEKALPALDQLRTTADLVDYWRALRRDFRYDTLIAIAEGLPLPRREDYEVEIRQRTEEFKRVLEAFSDNFSGARLGTVTTYQFGTLVAKIYVDLSDQDDLKEPPNPVGRADG